MRALVRKWVWWSYGALWGISALAVFLFMPRGEDGILIVLKLVGVLGVILATLFMLIAQVIPKEWYQESDDRQ